MTTTPKRHAGLLAGLILAAGAAVALSVGTADAMTSAPDTVAPSVADTPADHLCGILSWDTALDLWQDDAPAVWDQLLADGWHGDSRDGWETIYDPGCSVDDVATILADN